MLFCRLDQMQVALMQISHGRDKGNGFAFNLPTATLLS
jgi:hypothetical protein